MAGDTMTMKRTKFNIRTIAVTGMLGALATVLMFLEFPIPMLIPPFIKFDFSELPALLAAYAMGPVSGIAVCFIKNAINLLVNKECDHNTAHSFDKCKWHIKPDQCIP